MEFAEEEEDLRINKYGILGVLCGLAAGYSGFWHVSYLFNAKQQHRQRGLGGAGAYPSCFGQLVAGQTLKNTDSKPFTLSFIYYECI